MSRGHARIQSSWDKFTEQFAELLLGVMREEREELYRFLMEEAEKLDGVRITTAENRQKADALRFAAKIVKEKAL